MTAFVHPSALIEDDVEIGAGTKVWANAQVRTGARIGADCVLGRNTFVDVDVAIGDRVKIQNNASLFEGVELADGVFVGPHVVFTNDKVPRAITPGGRLKEAADWQLGRTRVLHGASIGAGTVVVTGIVIGRWAMVGSGAVLTADVPDHALVVGNPARVIGYVSAAGVRHPTRDAAEAATLVEAEDDA